MKNPDKIKNGKAYVNEEFMTKLRDTLTKAGVVGVALAWNDGTTITWNQNLQGRLLLLHACDIERRSLDIENEDKAQQWVYNKAEKMEKSFKKDISYMG